MGQVAELHTTVLERLARSVQHAEDKRESAILELSEANRVFYAALNAIADYEEYCRGAGLYLPPRD